MLKWRMACASLWLAGLLLAGPLISSESSAQQQVNDSLKEVQLDAKSFTVADPVPAWVEPSTLPEVSKPAPMVLRLVDTQYLVDRVPVSYVRRALLINDASSLTAAGRLSISFAPEYERVQLHSILIFRGQERLDRTASSNLRFLRREQGLEQGIYSGRVTASILVDDLRVGDTLDVSYSLYGENPVFGGNFTGLTAWDQGYPTLLRRVVLTHPVGRHIDWRMIGDRPAPPVLPKETIRDGLRKLAFEQAALPDPVSEPQVQPDYFGFRMLQFSEFSSWSDVVRWADGLFQTQTPPGDELQEIERKLRGLSSDEARVTAALEFVQSSIRYFSVSLGESSHRPAAPAVVLQHRYGDCKDKSSLLVTLLRDVGIQSRPVLLQIGRRSGLEKTLPSVQFFNHAIVQVTLQGRVFYLDPTRLGQHGRLDRMGQAHEGAQVLVVAPDTRDLTTIATPNLSELISNELQEHASLASFGSEGRLESKHVWHGVAAEQLRVVRERVSRDQLFKSIGDAMERRYPGAKLADEPVVSDDPVQNVFSIAANYRVPQLAVDRDGSWIVSFKPDNLQDVLLTSPTATRITPLRIPAFPFLGKYSFEMIFPQEVSVATDPVAQTIADKYFNLTASSYFRGNIARKTIELATLNSHVDPADMAKYSDDLRSTGKAIGGVFGISKAALKSNQAAQPFPQRLRDQREDVIKKTTETITGGKLTGSDLADSYCLRGTAQDELGRDDQALQDVNEAVRLAPNTANAYGCRGGFYFQAGQFDKSIADFSKAIALGSTDGMAFRSRGVSKFYQGHLAEAASDFAKASLLADKENKFYNDIWLVTSLSRLKKPLPEAIVKGAAAESSGEWPRPALAMLTGALSPGEMMQRLEQKKGDERTLALAEGYFYLGQHYLILGDRNAARAAFAKAREQDIFFYTEHIAAGFELQHLGADGPAPAVAAARPAAATAAATPVGSAPLPPAQTTQTAGAARTGATSVRDGTGPR